LGDSTVLVDADLRKPGVGRLLNLAGGKYAGLSSYLAGVSSLDLVSVPHPAIPNLVAIPTGPLPPNPADLLSSHKLVDAIAELRAKFKFIVIDSPPIMAATDAVILSVQADGVLLVVRSGETPKEAFTRTRDLLTSVKCRILGVVLNAWMPAPRTTTTLTGIIRTRTDMVPRRRLMLRMKMIPMPLLIASPAIATMTCRPFKEALCAI